MKVLITGGAGFIGSHVVDRLISRGDHIVNIDNIDPCYDVNIKLKNIQNHESPNYSFIKGDIRNKELLQDVFAKNDFDIVLHLAAKTGVRPSIQDPREYSEVNILGTLNILECMKDFNVKKIIFASSSSIYGNNSKTPFSETDAVDFPISPYAATKKSGELLCYNYHHLYNINITCLRFFTVYGPRQRPEMAISYFVKSALTGLPIQLFGDGTSLRDYTYIDDIVDGIFKAIEHCSGYNIYNLGESQTTSLTELIAIIEDVCSKKIIKEKLPLQKGDVNLTYADINKARNEIGYNPKTLIKDGVKKYVDWINEK